MTRLAVLISGTGTNLQAIIDASASGQLDAEVALVISSRPDAAGLQRAAAAGIQTVSLSRAVYIEPWAADQLIAEQVSAAGCDYIALAGYMRKIGPELVEAFPQRVINLHPALLPAFKGAQAIAEAYAYGVKVTGVTVHFVDAQYDTGPIIAQRAIAVPEGQGLEQLTERIHAVEHQLYPEVLQLLSQGRVEVIGKNVHIH
ncbi:MAG: phosphoribosylglycinamide formyltransferase [Coriobacteriia bacterium]|nr:phosphoribosylglycinamide formyltransferase [Coriobacteriia bacterium]